MAAKKTIVALNLGSQRVTMGVFVPGSRGSLQLRRYASADLLPDPAADSTRSAQIRTAVEELAGKLKVRSDVVRYAVPGRTAFMRFVKLPPLDIDKVDQIVYFEAQQNVPFPMDEVVWDYQIVGENPGSEVEVIIVAVKAETLDELHGSVTSSVKADGVDAAPMALYNAFRFNYGELAEPSLLIDIGARSTNLVYIEGDRVFARNTTSVGGATLTQAIAKEFGADFATAENRKVADGMVSLGGAYEDHPDPEVAAISKVIRNTLTRLHADVVRTTNQYRSQQGGEAPQRVFICGGTAGLGYIKEFFEEKLKLPVEFFNPLRHVGIGPNVDVDAVAREAHRLGEVVGVALRGVGSCPMEIDLVPASVERARDVQARRPYLILAAAVAFLALVAGIAYFSRADTLSQVELDALEDVENELGGWNAKIAAVEKEIEQDQARSAVLEQTVVDRTYWLELLQDVNQRLPNELVWLVSLDPMVGGKSISGREIAISPDQPPPMPGRGESEAVAEGITALHLVGLYRDEKGGPDAVNQFLDALAQSPYFDVPDLELNRTKYNPRLMRSGGRGDKWAYQFEFVLPLKRTLVYP